MKRKIFIMGASTGIGKALAINYASDNTILGLGARRVELLEELKEECELRNCETFIYENDVNIPLDCERSAQDFINKAKGIDIIIANSGVGSSDHLFSGSSEKINNVLHTNILGVTNTILPFLFEMQKQKQGKVVVVSSVASFIPIPHKGGYSASKVAVRRLFDSWRPILSDYGIDAISICPGFIDTPMTKKILFKPFLKDVNSAALAFIRAIDKNKETYVYPWQMSVLTRLINLLPQFIIDSLIYRSKNRITKYDKN